MSWLKSCLIRILSLLPLRFWKTLGVDDVEDHNLESSSMIVIDISAQKLGKSDKDFYLKKKKKGSESFFPYIQPRISLSPPGGWGRSCYILFPNLNTGQKIQPLFLNAHRDFRKYWKEKSFYKLSKRGHLWLEESDRCTWYTTGFWGALGKATHFPFHWKWIITILCLWCWKTVSVIFITKKHSLAWKVKQPPCLKKISGKEKGTNWSFLTSSPTPPFQFFSFSITSFKWVLFLPCSFWLIA